MAIAIATAIMPTSALRPTSSPTGNTSIEKSRTRVKMLGDFSHLAEVVKKDVRYLRRKARSGMEWANEAFHIPKAMKFVDDLVWLRVFEDKNRTEDENVYANWPRFSYPGKGNNVSFVEAKSSSLTTGFSSEK